MKKIISPDEKTNVKMTEKGILTLDRDATIIEMILVEEVKILKKVIKRLYLSCFAAYTSLLIITLPKFIDWMTS